MRHTRLPAAVVLVLLVLVVSGARAQTLQNEVERYLEPYLRTGNFSGAVLIARRDTVLLSRGYGLADSETGDVNTPETVFHLASVSRIFTSAAILLLEQRGLLSVEDPISRHLPDWPRGDEITIHHLLSLSSGLPNINSLPGYGRWQATRQTPSTLAAKFRDLPLEYVPGTRSEHSNSNYVLLALLVERISGRPFGDFLEEWLFAPLGMRSTAHHGKANEEVARGAIGYTPVGLAEMRPTPVIDWSVKAGHGSVYSTVSDLYRFDRALAKASLLDEEMVSKLLTEHFPSNGYGWFVGERFGAQLVYINGRSPGFGAYWGRSVEEDVTVIVLGNLYSSAPNTIAEDLLALTLGASYEVPTIQFEPPDPELLAEVAGSYQFGPEFYRPNGTVAFHVRDGHLFNGRDWVMPSTAGPLHFVHRIYWSDLEFRRDTSGRVTELLYDDYVGHRQ